MSPQQIQHFQHLDARRHRAASMIWLAVTGACMAAVAYGSLLPFHFRGLPTQFFSLAALQPPRKTGISLEDVLVNLLVYVPIGFSATWLLRSLRRGPIGAMAFAIIACSALSLLVENLQSVIPERVPSATDFAVNLIGGALGAAIAQLGPIGWRACAPGFRDSVHERPLHVLGLLVGGALLVTQLFPFDFVRTSDELHAAFRRSQWSLPFLSNVGISHGVGSWIVNELPIASWFAAWAGMIALDRRLRGIAPRRAFTVAACETAAVTALLEVVQLFVLSHVFEASVIVLRGGVAVLGAAVGTLHAERVQSAPWRKRPAILVPTWSVLILATLQIVPHLRELAYAVRSAAWDAMPSLRLALPFVADWRGTMSHAAGKFLDDAIAAIAICIPLSILARRIGLRRPWFVAVLGIVMVGLVTTFVDATRSNRALDLTHPIMATLTAAMMSRIYPALRSRFYLALNRA